MRNLHKLYQALGIQKADAPEILNLVPATHNPSAQNGIQFLEEEEEVDDVPPRAFGQKNTEVIDCVDNAFSRLNTSDAKRLLIHIGLTRLKT